MTRENVYAKVTQGILDRLAQGVAPWHKPWDATMGQPRNFASGHIYTGINALALGMMGASPHWLTFNQVNRMGLQIRKGSKGVPIIYTSSTKVQDESTNGDGTMSVAERNVRFVKYYHVFNALDIEGLTIQKVDHGKETWEAIAEADWIVAGVKPAPRILHGGNVACFDPSTDHIRLPERSAFSKAEDYCSTRFHELTHWTGHATRLNRATMNNFGRFGDATYSQEELVAEMGAGYLCALSGIEN